MHDKVLVTDFDGTITQHDFYRLAIERLIPSDCHDYWADYRSGRLTHFDALAAYFREIRTDEPTLLAVVRDMQMDPQFRSCVNSMRARGWHIVVTSAGCQWYIDTLLKEAGVALEIHANPGSFSPKIGLQMIRPVASEFFCHDIGINKAAVVQRYCDTSELVAFAGDGFPDIQAAKLVGDDLRFARGDLATQLASEGLPFRSFETWSEIATVLLDL